MFMDQLPVEFGSCGQGEVLFIERALDIHTSSEGLDELLDHWIFPMMFLAKVLAA